MSKDTDIVIVKAKRTALGSFNGSLASVTAAQLAATVIRDISVGLEQKIQSVTMGCVLTAGLRQAPARQAALAAGLPNSVACTTVNKVCGSSLQSVIYAYQELQTTDSTAVIAGGMENMSQAPYLLPKARFGQRLGHGQTLDHMFYDGLENAYDQNHLMGYFADQTSEHYQFTREELDAFATTSTHRAQQAQAAGLFAAEIVPVIVPSRNQEITVDQDESPRSAKPEKLPKLRPAFNADGTTTAGNASSISDGAAALLLMTAQAAREHSLQPLAKIRGYASHAQQPEWFTTAPVGAIQKLLSKLDWTADEVDRFEINEAFAAVTLAAIRDLKLDPDKVNVYGGAVALGHPIGATGSRLLVTLINQLQQDNLRTGIASACIGGGEALAIAIERLT